MNLCSADTKKQIMKRRSMHVKRYQVVWGISMVVAIAIMFKASERNSNDVSSIIAIGALTFLITLFVTALIGSQIELLIISIRRRSIFKEIERRHWR